MEHGSAQPGNARPWVDGGGVGLPAMAIAVKKRDYQYGKRGCGRSMGGFVSTSESKSREVVTRE